MFRDFSLKYFKYVNNRYYSIFIGQSYKLINKSFEINGSVESAWDTS